MVSHVVLGMELENFLKFEVPMVVLFICSIFLADDFLSKRKHMLYLTEICCLYFLNL